MTRLQIVVWHLIAYVIKQQLRKLFTKIGPRHVTRPGGYLRVLKCGFRTGDNAPMALVEIVGRQEEA